MIVADRPVPRPQSIMLAHTAANDVLNERLQSGTLQQSLNVGKWAISADPRVPENDRELGKRR